MPIYNASRWLEETLESLLQQTFRDFELIVSDNASEDDSVRIVESIAARDQRIRLIRQPRNIGANRNYGAVLAAARGELFKWASSNDLCAPAFFERCVAGLDAAPDAVLAYPRTRIFTDDPESGQIYDRDFALLEADSSRRFRNLFYRIELNNAMNGVIRRAALLAALPMGNFRSADILLMAELALRGKYILVDEPMFLRRMSPEAATSKRGVVEADRHLVPAATRPLRWQHWLYQMRMLRIAMRASPSARDFLRCIKFVLGRTIAARGNLIADVTAAFRSNYKPIA